MEIDRIQFRPGSLEGAIEKRGATNNAEASVVVQRDIDRYYQLLQVALASVNLKDNEAELIAEALGSTGHDVNTAQMLSAIIAKDMRINASAKSWDILDQGESLLQKIDSWTLLQRMAVCDAVERYWIASKDGDFSSDLLALVGLSKRG